MSRNDNLFEMTICSTHETHRECISVYVCVCLCGHIIGPGSPVDSSGETEGGLGAALKARVRSAAPRPPPPRLGHLPRRGEREGANRSTLALSGEPEKGGGGGGGNFWESFREQISHSLFVWRTNYGCQPTSSVCSKDPNMDLVVSPHGVQ